MKSFILLENIEIYAKHGVFGQENVVGNIFIINIKMTVDIENASYSDKLDDTVSYANVFDIIKEEMLITSKLLEHVGGRIIRRLKAQFPPITEIELKISKRNPPVTGQVEYASILLID